MNKIYKSISDEPFWRPPDRERTCSSGIRLGGFTKDTQKDLEERLAQIDKERKEFFQKDSKKTLKWQEKVNELCKEEQKIRKKLREMKIKI